MLSHDMWFIVTLTKEEPDISLRCLWERYRDHGGLSDERAAGDILRVIELGYIAGSVKLTEAGAAYLKKPAS